LDIFASIQVLCWLCFHSEPCGLEWVYQSRFVAFRVLDQQSHAGMIGIHTRDKLLSLKWDNTPLTIIQVLTTAVVYWRICFFPIEMVCRAWSSRGLVASRGWVQSTVCANMISNENNESILAMGWERSREKMLRIKQFIAKSRPLTASRWSGACFKS
jgi:hypothetical protein